MKIIKESSKQGKWLFDDRAVPFQVRVINSEEIHFVKHLHKTMHEYFYVLEGTMKIMVSDIEYHFQKDDLFIVEPNEVHHVTEKSGDLKLFLIMPPPVPGDKEVIN